MKYLSSLTLVCFVTFLVSEPGFAIGPSCGEVLEEQASDRGLSVQDNTLIPFNRAGELSLEALEDLIQMRWIPGKRYYEGWAHDYSFTEMRISALSTILLKPNFEKYRSWYGNIPILAHISPEGISHVRPMFQNASHPLRKFMPADYDYHLDFDLKTSVGRAVFTTKEKSDFSPAPELGHADVFFVGPHGEELKSLSQAIKTTLNNVVALTDTIYYVESKSGQLSIVEYNPVAEKVNIIFKFKASLSERLVISKLFQKEANKKKASAYFDGNQMAIVTQTHKIIVELASSGEGSSFNVSLTGQDVEGYSGAQRDRFYDRSFNIKVINGLSQATELPALKMIVFHGTVKIGQQVDATEVLMLPSFSKRSGELGPKRSWKIPTNLISNLGIDKSSFFSVEGGILVQMQAYREGLRRVDSRFVFLGYNGDIKILDLNGRVSLGAATVLNGTLIYVDDKGKNLKFIQLK